MSRGKLVLAHALIALQLLLAIGYYAWRTDRLDERFAWRMFSVQRFARCQVAFRVGEPPVNVALHSEFHEAWVNIARRGRRQVIEAMAAHLCSKNRNEPVTVIAKCNSLGTIHSLSSGGFDVCKTGRL